MRRLPLVALSLIGCAASPQSPRVAPPSPFVIEVPAARPLGEGVSPKAATSALFPEVTEPRDAACRLASERWSHSSLRLAPRGTVFASVRLARATLVFPVGGQPDGATVVFDTDEVELRGYVVPEELPVYLQAPKAFGGFLYPHPGTALGWIGGQHGALRVKVPTSSSPVVVDGLSEDVGCTGLGLTPGEFDVRALITKKKSLPSLAVLRDGAPLALEPGGPTVATLAAFSTAEVLAQRGAFTRVLLPGSAYLAVGWVASRDLGNGFGAGHGRLAGRHIYRKTYWGEGRTCDHDLALTVLVGSERVRVGTLRAGARFDASDLRDEPDSGMPPPRSTEDRPERWVGVTIHRLSWLELDESARLEVQRDELASCAVARE